MEQYNLFKKKCGEIESRFGGTRKLKILPVIDLSVLDKNTTLLEIGNGGSKRFQNLCNDYITIDCDKGAVADFLSIHSFIKTGQRVNNIIANQVAEHLTKEELVSELQNWCSVLMPQGTIIITIPNVMYWYKYIADYDHKNPLSFFHLGALIETSCKDMQVIDCYKYGKRYNDIKNATDGEKFLFDFLLKYYELDPYDFIAVVAQKLW